MSDKDKMLHVIGFYTLVAVCAWFIMERNLLERKLSDCAKQHNVYSCEYVAVPKKDIK